MASQFKYFAFISYQSLDLEWAIWLEHELEEYNLPSNLNGKTTNHGEQIRDNLRDVFRDTSRLSAGNLSEQIKQALRDSANLIVICSPHSADVEQHPWVNDEVEFFIKLRRIDKIFPFIVDGNTPEEYFPKSLLELRGTKHERLGGNVKKDGANVNEDGRDAAFIKVVSGMLDVDFDSLWQRYERQKAKKERIEREKRDNLLRLQSRYVAEKVNALVEHGDSYTATLLALEVLPGSPSEPDRPYVAEAEDALRNAAKHNTAVIDCNNEPVWSVDFNPDGTQILSSSYENKLRVWDSRTGACLKIWDGHSDGVGYAEYSQDGRLIVSCGSGKDKSVKVWDAQTTICTRVFELPDYVTGVRISHDGKYTACGCYDNAIRVYDVITGECVQIFQGHTQVVNAVAFSPDGTIIASGSADHTLRLWDMMSGQCIKVLEGHDGDISFVSFSPTQSTLVSVADGDATIRIWNYLDGTCRKVIDRGNGVFSIKFSVDGRFFVTAEADWKIRIWSSDTGECVRVLKGHEDWGTSACFSPDGNSIVSSSRDGIIRLWDVSDLTTHGKSGLTSKQKRLSDGEASMAYMNPFPLPDLSGTPSDNQALCIKEFIVNDETPVLALFNHDGEKVLSFTSEGSAYVWDAESGKLLHSFYGDPYDVYTASINKKGSLIATGTWDNTVRVFDMVSGDCIANLDGHTECVLSVSFSPDDSMLLSCSNDNTVRLWDTNSWRLIRVFKEVDGTPISASFIPGERKIVITSPSSPICIFDLDTGELLEKHSSNWNGFVAISPDGKRIALTSTVFPNTVKVYELVSWRCIESITVESTRVVSAVFSPDGLSIITASSDGIIRIWESWPLPYLIDRLKEKFKNRDLTEDEKRRFYLK